MTFAFPKKFRSIKKNKISLFFAQKDQWSIYPFLVRYFSEKSTEGSYRILISVSRKKIPLAVTRNLIKRRIREAWRIHAPKLLESLREKKILLYINLHFTQAHPVTFTEIDNAINHIIIRLIHMHENVAE